MSKINNQKGAATLIFVTILAIIVTLLIAVTHSRLLLALRRSQSAADTIISGYDAESEAYDVISKLANGLLDIDSLGTYTKTFGDTTLIVSGEQIGNKQIVTVTAKRLYAVNKVQAVREVQSIENATDVDIVMALDCTSSMDSGVPTRFEALESAALNFIDSISSRTDSSKFRLGVLTFGVNAEWIKLNGRDVVPSSNMKLSDVRFAVEQGFGPTKDQSPACVPILNSTSIGSGVVKAHEYFESHARSNTKQIEIVITDGEPNSRIPEPKCSPNVYCPLFASLCSNPYGWSCYPQRSEPVCSDLGLDFLRCTVANSDTYVPEIGQYGIRNPDVDIYAVTIFDNPPQPVVEAFQTYTTENGYYNASRATDLTKILDTLLQTIVEKRSTVTIKRVIPEVE
ncbi:VWA domain-containing protein [Candidatus Microgenomates bacterium]|nr:MAG: VWA domain-containing protein [Candidatus Microgenomates bacterium]